MDYPRRHKRTRHEAVRCRLAGLELGKAKGGKNRNALGLYKGGTLSSIKITKITPWYGPKPTCRGEECGRYLQKKKKNHLES